MMAVATRHGAARLIAGTIISLGAVLSVQLLVADAVAPALHLAAQLNVAAYLLVGLLLVERRPGHRVGTVLFAFGVGLGVLQLGDAYVRLPGSPPAAPLAATLFNHGELVLFPMLAALFVIFPDGRPISRRWWWLVGATGVTATLAFVSYVLQPGPLSYYGQFDSVLGVAGFPGQEIGGPAYLMVAIGLAASASALVVRWRRSGPVVRAQIKWVAVAALAIGGILAVGVLTRETRATSELAPLVGSVAAVMLPISIGIAILRYRLFEIDRLISRSIGWALVTGLLLVIFVSAILVLQGLLDEITQGDTLAVAASTLIAFALLQPVRRRVQGAVDRRFNRTGAHAREAINAFGVQLRDQVDLGEIDRDIRGTVDAAVAPSSIGVWLRGVGGAGR